MNRYWFSSIVAVNLIISALMHFSGLPVAIVHMAKGCVSLFLESEPKAAIAELTESIKRFELPHALLIRGLAHQQNGDYKFADRDFSALLGVHQNFVEARKLRVITRLNNEDFGGALQDLNYLIDVQGIKTEELLTLRNKLIELRDYQQSSKVCTLP